MATLNERLLGDNRARVEADCVRLIGDEVASKRGATGLAIKAGFKAIRAFKRDIVPDAVHHLLPDFVQALTPLYDEHQQGGGGDIEAFVRLNGERVADALLGITDGRARTSRHKALVKAYNRLRPMGKKQVVAAMPGLGRMLKDNDC